MATSETAKLLASLELKDKFTPTLKNANRALGQFDSKLSNTEGRAYRAGQQIGTGIRNVGKLAVVGFGVVAANVALGLDSLIKLESATAQTEAVIKSTGQVAGVTAKDVRTLAESFEAMNATVGDETIQQGANLLLTFTNVSKKAFEPALQTILDMNTALGKGPDGLAGTVKVVGKALNDPTKGLSALSRVGVTFNKEQTKRIKDLQKEGKLYEAQAIILAELEKRFGGSFLAGGGTTAGKVAKFTDSIEDLQRAMATALLPAIGNIADALTELLADPEVIKGAEALGHEIGKLFSKENIKTGAKAIGDLFKLIRDAAPAIGSALGTIGTVLSTAFKAFTSLPKEVQALLIGGVAANKLTGGLITNIAGGIFGALKAMTVQAGVVHVSGPVAGLPGGGANPVPGGKGGGIGGGVLALGFAGAVLAAAVPIGEAFAAALPEGLKGPNGAGESESQRRIREGIAAMEEKQGRTIEKINVLGVTFGRGQGQTTSATDRVKQAALETKRETNRSGTIITAAQRAAASSIVGAIHSLPAPIVNVSTNVSVTSVVKKTTTVNRYGSSSGSRNRDAADSRYGPN